MPPFTTAVRGKLSAARHKAFVRGASGIAPFYVVNEFPKSGGTWLAQMLSDALALPFRRNEPIRFERSITHGHFLNPIGLRNTVVLWRDPRDIIISFYYHSYFVNEHHNARYVAMMKARHPFDDYNDIRSNLPDFIKHLTLDPVSPKFTLIDFAKVWANRPGTVQTSYEALRADTAGEIGRVIHDLVGQNIAVETLQAIVEANSLKKAKAKVTQTSSAAEMSFIREGSLGGWRKHFSPQSDDCLRDYGYVEVLRGLGYA